jgi:hypothetical protein
MIEEVNLIDDRNAISYAIWIEVAWVPIRNISKFGFDEMC